MGWGVAGKRRAGLVLLLTGGVAVASLALLWADAEARARTQGTWCERTGPHPSQLAMVSNDGGETWTYWRD